MGFQAEGSAPIVLNHIVEHPQTGEKVTLDGVFGMNLLVASANIDGGTLFPQIGDSVSGPFDAIIIDHATGILGVQHTKELRESVNTPRGGRR